VLAKSARVISPVRAANDAIFATPARGKPGAGSKKKMKQQEEAIELEGTIKSVLAGTMFRVELPSKHVVLAHISGRMRKRFIRLTTGDRVKLEMSPYDVDKARIVYRLG
jgi:translation initiation factor IF-1